ncbi:unnamed protein product [Didymodactylos carnosus]|uniref:Uncharacterized protein n=1 Tax=Didymodactylos carnosus TaxID=1234261 RepID=A0A8S2UF73_9BILA|nr:unnamed protein product [Didymodactylos carnosus]
MKELFKKIVSTLYRLRSKQILNQGYSATTLRNKLDPDHNVVLSFHGLRKARRVLQYISCQYMYYHNLEPKDFMTYMDILTFVESAIYLIDEVNEQADENEKRFKFDFSNKNILSDNEFFDNVNRNYQLSTLFYFLKNHNFYDNYVHRQLHDALLYYKLEQYCVSSFTESNSNNPLNEDLVQKCNSLRSFDIRLLDLILYKLTNQPYEDELLKCLYYREIMYESADDLLSYEQDILKNTFNIYRMYAHLYPNNSELYFNKYIRILADQYKKIFNYLLLQNPQLMKQHQQLDERNPSGLIYKEIKSNEFDVTENWIRPKCIHDEYTWKKNYYCDLQAKHI